MKPEKRLEQIEKRMRALCVDLYDVRSLADLPFQIKRLGELCDDVADVVTKIQGSGTGRD